MTARAALAAILLAAALLLSGCRVQATQDVTSGLPSGVGCMVEITAPDGHTAYYKPDRSHRIIVPNGTPHPYVAKCAGGAIVAQPGSGDLPS